MSLSKVSSKYQIVIPSKIRKSLNIKVGEEVQLIEYMGRIEIVPVRPINEMFGFLKGMNPDFVREDEDRV
ncbi:MAG: AbrB/MazE/SpoVT family DNA-binding domain-containing protein [Candidatus Kapabacteria bacterium]|nr:AbrB/MazE/SpoVT family DNA-binding domain-containing protein [Candidatus Kapabacteria bacterium]